MNASKEARLTAAPSARPGIPSCCQECGALAATKCVEFWQIIGAVVVFHVRTNRGFYCKSCIHQFFWSFTLVSLCLGWWGCLSFVLTPFVLLHNLLRYAFCLGMPPVPKEKSITPTAAGRTETDDSDKPSAKPVVRSKAPWTARIRGLYRSLRKGRRERGIPCVQCTKLAFPIEGTNRYRCRSCGCRFEDSER
jgi:hypothetical protein